MWVATAQFDAGIFEGRDVAGILVAILCRLIHPGTKELRQFGIQVGSELLHDRRVPGRELGVVPVGQSPRFLDGGKEFLIERLDALLVRPCQGIVKPGQRRVRNPPHREHAALEGIHKYLVLGLSGFRFPLLYGLGIDKVNGKHQKAGYGETH